MAPGHYDIVFKHLTLMGHSDQNYSTAESYDARMKSFYLREAPTYDNWLLTEGVQAFQAAEREFLVENVVPRTRLIDFGCGTGEHLLPLIDKHCDLFGVDFVPEMLKIAQIKLGDAATLIMSDVREISFPDNFFDYGVCFCTLPNLEDFDTVFSKFAKISGSLIISVYDWESRFELAKFYSRNGLSPRIEDERHRLSLEEGLCYIFLSADTVIRLFEDNGFHVNVIQVPFGKIYQGTKRG